MAHALYFSKKIFGSNKTSFQKILVKKENPLANKQFTIWISMILNFSPIITYAEEQLNQDLMKMIHEFIPPNAIPVSPEEPKSTKPYQFYDFNQDGQEEMIITFKMALLNINVDLLIIKRFSLSMW